MKTFQWLVLLAGLCLTLLPGQPPAPKTDGGAAAANPSKALDINTASIGELKGLPGIGEKYSARIVAGRPYANKAQLVAKGILPKATYNRISKLIVARQP